MPELSDRVVARSEHNALPALDRLKMRLKALTTPDELEHFNDSEVLSPGYAQHQNAMAEHIGREKPYGRDEEAEIKYRDVELVEKYRREQQAKKDAEQPQKLRQARQEYTDEFMAARRKFMRKQKADEKKRKQEEDSKQTAAAAESKPKQEALQKAGEEYREEFMKARDDFAKHEEEIAERERKREEERAAKEQEKAEKDKAKIEADEAVKKQALAQSAEEYSKELEQGRTQFPQDQERWDQQSRDVDERLKARKEAKDAQTAADEEKKREALRKSGEEYAEELQRGRDQFPQDQERWDQQSRDVDERLRIKKEEQDAQDAADKQKSKEETEADEAAKRELLQQSREEYVEELQRGRDQFPEDQRRWEQQDEELNEKLRKQKEERETKAKAEVDRKKEEFEADENTKKQALRKSGEEYAEELQRGRDQFPQDQERWDQQSQDVDERIRAQKEEQEAKEAAEKQRKQEVDEANRVVKQQALQQSRNEYTDELQRGRDQFSETQARWQQQDKDVDEKLRKQKEEENIRAEAEAAKRREEAAADEEKKKEALKQSKEEYAGELQRGRDQFPQDQERWDEQDRNLAERLRNQKEEKDAQAAAEAEEKRKMIARSREKSDKELKEGGAKYIRRRENGKFVSGPARLDVTDEQWETAHQEMESDFSKREEKSDQVEEVSGIQARIRQSGEVIRKLRDRVSNILPSRTRTDQEAQSQSNTGDEAHFPLPSPEMQKAALEQAQTEYQQEFETARASYTEPELQAGDSAVDTGDENEEDDVITPEEEEDDVEGTEPEEAAVVADATSKPVPQADAHLEKTATDYDQAVSRFVTENNIELRGLELQRFTLYVKSNNRTDIAQAYDDYLKETAPEPKDVEEIPERTGNPIVEAALGMAALDEHVNPQAKTEAQSTEEVTEDMIDILKAGAQNNAEPWQTEFLRDTDTLKHMQKPGLFRSLSREQLAQFDRIMTNSLDRMADLPTYESNPDVLLKAASRNLAFARVICQRNSPARELIAEKLEDMIDGDPYAMNTMHEYTRVGHNNVLDLFSLSKKDTSYYKGVLTATFRNKELHPTELANLLGIPEVRELLKQAVLGMEVKEADNMKEQSS